MYNERYNQSDRKMELPASFIERTRELLGDAAYTEFETALQVETPVSIRLNPAKAMRVWKSASFERAVPVPWATDAYYLSRRPAFTFDPLFHAGCYYVQEASSMFVERALRTYVDRPVVMLDLCAAPGGKSTLCRAALPEGSLLVANEVMRNRSQILAENLIKWGHPEVVVTNNDPADFTSLTHVFDVLLTDVPCSGEGMFRKDPVAVAEWSEANVQLCWQRQRRILSDVWPALKPGGLLLYSTCTFNREENEDNVAWIADTLGAEVLEVATDSSWGITGNLTDSSFPVYRFLPHRTRGEGFFLAVLRKQDEGLVSVSYDSAEGYVGIETMELEPGDSSKGKSGKKEKGDKRVGKKAKVGKGKMVAEGKGTGAVPAEVKEWLHDATAYDFIVRADDIEVFPRAHASVYAQLRSQLKVLHAGVTLATMKGKDCLPHPSLALSNALALDKFPVVDLSEAQALAFLRKEAVTLEPEVPRGCLLLTFRNIPLGFVKNIGNRANNLYPAEWRIRSTYLPEERITLEEALCPLD